MVRGSMDPLYIQNLLLKNPTISYKFDLTIQVEVIEEILDYTDLDLLNAFGSYMGLFLGASFLAMYDQIVNYVLTICQKVSRRPVVLSTEHEDNLGLEETCNQKNKKEKIDVKNGGTLKPQYSEFCNIVNKGPKQVEEFLNVVGIIFPIKHWNCIHFYMIQPVLCK